LASERDEEHDVGDRPAIAARVVRWMGARAWFGVVPLTIATILGFAGRLVWWLELASHFRLQLFWGSSIVFAMFVLARRRVGMICAALLCATNAAVIVPLYLAAPVSVGAVDRPILRLLIANVHTGNRDHGRLLELVGTENPDLLLLEEIDAVWLAALEPLTADYPYRIVRPRADNFGIAMWSRVPIEARVRWFGSAGVPSIQAQLQHAGSAVRVLLTHPLPPMSARNARLRDSQARAVARAVRQLGGRVILAGDFNMTCWSPAFADLLEESGLSDSTRGFGPQTTWPTTLPLPCRIPIDHCLHTPDFEVVDRRVGPDIGSDHLPLVVDLR
jgi:endonuclease/exonuclease/phosphatase (EEP) superfamily protein YafD